MVFYGLQHTTEFQDLMDLILKITATIHTTVLGLEVFGHVIY